ncbi:MAG: T9SS type A sorting domain-containing protein [Chitinophagales bacterium]
MTRFFTKCLVLLCLAVLCCFSLQNAAAQCGAGEVSVGIKIHETGDFLSEVGWQLVDSGANEIASDCDPTAEACTQLCLTEGENYTFNAFDSFGDGWNGNSFSIYLIDGPNAGCEIINGSPSNNTLGSSICPSGGDLEDQFVFDPAAPACATLIDLSGCTDPSATNYDACAATDDGSCVYPPDNDLCADAETIECGDVLSGTTVNANFDDVGSCVTSNTSPGVWYHFIGTGADVTVDICGATHDSKMSIFEGDCGDLVCVIGEDDDYAVCGGNDPSVDFTSVKCKDYYILVHGFSSGTGDFDITLTCSEDIEVVAEGCTDPNAHNYEAAACVDNGSCETCDDKILNGDEIDVDCGGALCAPCPCGIQVNTDVVASESGCAPGAKQRVVLVSFTGGIPPITYTPMGQGSTFISEKAPGVYQVVGYGPWSISASDPSGCFQIAQSSDMVYVSDQSATNETAAGAADGTATVEATGGTPPYDVAWSNGSTGTIEASGGTHTITNAVSGYHEAVVTDANGEVAKVCIYVGRNSSTGGGRGRGRKTADITTASTLIAQPNPFANSTIVHFNIAETSNATVSVFALDGKQVTTVFEGQAEAGENYHVELNASQFATGVYILRLTTDSGVVEHQRIVVAK